MIKAILDFFGKFGMTRTPFVPEREVEEEPEFNVDFHYEVSPEIQKIVDDYETNKDLWSIKTDEFNLIESLKREGGINIRVTNQYDHIYVGMCDKWAYHIIEFINPERETELNPRECKLIFEKIMLPQREIEIDREIEAARRKDKRFKIRINQILKEPQ